MRGILAQAAQELYAVPTSAIERIVDVKPDEILHVGDSLAFEWDGETVTLVPLQELLEVHAVRGVQPPWPVIVAKTMGRRFGLLIDMVLPEQEFVFKRLPGWLASPENFSGATILGDGRIVLILEMDAIFQSASRKETLRASLVFEEKLKAPPASILVVEDSFITGEMEKSILQAAGYRAEVACDGVDALEMLRNNKYDLVLADFDMPRMDGLELTSQIRREDRLRHLPVIILTARESAEDRQRGLDAGAHAFMRKREFDQDVLIETIRRLVGR
jgi:two-component system chemotaxis sensor kinase CheA